jgi:tRNA threonylcarbamoyl adenosine modification protein (Sua5/YciO/YrdC/YwlC family)
MPTDTVYGLAADPRVAGAEERIYRAKERDRGKKIPILASSIERITGYGVRLEVQEAKLAETFWPGPLTLVLKAGDRDEGFRIPDHDVALELIESTGGILRVTSANLSGQAPALTAGEAVQAIGGFVEIVLDAGKVRGGTPSTVAKVDGGRVVVLRAGAINEKDLQAAVT